MYAIGWVRSVHQMSNASIEVAIIVVVFWARRMQVGVLCIIGSMCECKKKIAVNWLMERMLGPSDKGETCIV